MQHKCAEPALGNKQIPAQKLALKGMFRTKSAGWQAFAVLGPLFLPADLKEEAEGRGRLRKRRLSYLLFSQPAAAPSSFFSASF